MKQVVQIRCKNNKKTQKVANGSTLSDIFSSFNLKMEHGPVSAKVNNKVEGMHYRVYNNKDIEFLDMRTSSGSRAYTRTLFFVLCKAVQDLYPGHDVVIDIPVSNGFMSMCDWNVMLRPMMWTASVSECRKSWMHVCLSAAIWCLPRTP